MNTRKIVTAREQTGSWKRIKEERTEERKKDGKVTKDGRRREWGAARTEGRGRRNEVEWICCHSGMQEGTMFL